MDLLNVRMEIENRLMHPKELKEKVIYLIMGQQDRRGGLMITLQMSSWYYWVKMVHHF